MKFHASTYRTCDKEIVVEAMLEFYKEEAGAKKMTKKKAKKTLKKLSKNPQLGSIQVLLHKDTIIGYCLLINYWSNEYGGTIVFVDELYIKAAYRNLGIGTTFIHYLKNRSKKIVALCLEVLPDNKKASRFYKRLKFKDDKRKHLILEL